MTTLLYLVALYASTAAAARRRSARVVPVCTLASLAVVAACSVSQLTFAPWLLELLQRDAVRVRQGELFRLLTAALVQDGGWTSALSNLLALLVVGAVAEFRFGRLAWVLVALAGAVVGNLAGLWLEPVGAGSSVLVFPLAAALAVASLRAGVARELAVIGLTAMLFLCCLLDLHGVAGLTGALIALRMRARF